MIKKSSVLLISLIGIVLATVAFGLPPTKPHKMASLPVTNGTLAAN